MTEYTGPELSPSGALNRFQPPPDFIVGDAGAGSASDVGTYLERLRYGFRLGGIGLIIDSDTASEVIDPLPLSHLPNTPKWLLGLINLRGNLIPVFDLIHLFELDTGGAEQATRGKVQQRMLILGQGEHAVGVLINHLPDVPDLSRPLNSLPLLPDVLSSCVNNAYAGTGTIWLEFQHHRFFQSLTLRITDYL